MNNLLTDWEANITKIRYQTYGDEPEEIKKKVYGRIRNTRKNYLLKHPSWQVTNITFC